MDNLNYYIYHAETPFCGTDETRLIVANYEFEIDEDEVKQDLFDSYGYLINGWDGDDPTEEEYENFIADCYVSLEKVTKEQFKQEYETNGWDIDAYKI